MSSFNEKCAGKACGDATSGSTVTQVLATPAAGYRYVVRSVIIYSNEPTAAHYVDLRVISGGNSYMLFRVYMQGYDTLVHDTPIVLENGETLNLGIWNNLSSASYPFHVVVNYAEVS